VYMHLAEQVAYRTRCHSHFYSDDVRDVTLLMTVSFFCSVLALAIVPLVKIVGRYKKIQTKRTLLTLKVPNVEIFDRYEPYCTWQHLTSTAILSELHDPKIFGGNISMQLKSLGSFFWYIIYPAAHLTTYFIIIIIVIGGAVLNP
jgi:hypothetical protein